MKEKKTSLKSFRKTVERYGIFAIPMTLGNTTYTFVMIKNPKHDPKEPYIYLISDMKNAKAIADHYFKRWKIECCFKHLKSNGFNIENINLKDDHKIELMMGILAIVYLIAVREGLLMHQNKPIPFKKFKNGKEYLSISIFRMGMSIIQTVFVNIKELIDYINCLFECNEGNAFEENDNFAFTKYV